MSKPSKKKIEKVEEAAQEVAAEQKAESSSHAADYEKHPKFAKFKSQKDGE